MTPGTASARALMAHLLNLSTAAGRSWSAASRPFSIVEADQDGFAAAAASAVKGTLIRDNGLTKIAPGRATAMVLASAGDLL